MEETIRSILGQRIRHYRKQKHYSLAEFALLINKSKSSLSKYERGEVSIDVETLIIIAKNLDVHISQLLDMDYLLPTENLSQETPGSSQPGKIYYVYVPSLIQKKNKEVNILTINQEKASFYGRVVDPTDFAKCTYYYTGTVQTFDSSQRIFLANTANKNDLLVLDLTSNFGTSSIIVGLVCSLSLGRYDSFVSKCIATENPLTDLTEATALTAPTRDELNQLKKRHIFKILQT